MNLIYQNFDVVIVCILAMRLRKASLSVIALGCAKF